MTRASLFSSPLLLGFDHLEELAERLSRSANDGYPPYNVVQVAEDRLCITLAVAGFSQESLTVTVERNQLHVRGRQEEENGTVYLHRGIAARQFHRTFLLAEGIEVAGARLDNGLLHVDLTRQTQAEVVQTVEINAP